MPPRDVNDTPGNLGASLASQLAKAMEALESTAYETFGARHIPPEPLIEKRRCRLCKAVAPDFGAEVTHAEGCILAAPHATKVGSYPNHRRYRVMLFLAEGSPSRYIGTIRLLAQDRHEALRLAILEARKHGFTPLGPDAAHEVEEIEDEAVHQEAAGCDPMPPPGATALEKAIALLGGVTELDVSDRAEAHILDALDLLRTAQREQEELRQPAEKYRIRIKDVEDERDAARAEVAALKARAEPIPLRLPCPGCGQLHIDVGEFATKVHHTHSCQHCGLTWRPAVVPTVGVQFLPGFKDQP